jgi:hypothetical protein
MQRAQMSDGTIRSVAQHAHAHTVSVHWPSTGIGTFSSDEQVHWLPTRLASHWAIAVYCVLHFVTALTVASAAFTQVVWQSATGHAPVACDAHIAVQAWSRVRPALDPPAAFPPEPVFPPAPPAPPDRVVPPAAPPAAVLPPLETVPPDPTEPPLAVVPPLVGVPPVAVVPPLAGVPPLAVVPPLVGVPPEVGLPPLVGAPPVVAAPPEAVMPPVPGAPPVVACDPPVLFPEQAITPTSVNNGNSKKSRVVVMILLESSSGIFPLCGSGFFARGLVGLSMCGI